MNTTLNAPSFICGAHLLKHRIAVATDSTKKLLSCANDFETYSFSIQIYEFPSQQRHRHRSVLNLRLTLSSFVFSTGVESNTRTDDVFSFERLSGGSPSFPRSHSNETANGRAGNDVKNCGFWTSLRLHGALRSLEHFRRLRCC